MPLRPNLLFCILQLTWAMSQPAIHNTSICLCMCLLHLEQADPSGMRLTSSLGSSSASPSTIHWGCPVRAGSRNPGRAVRGCLPTPGTTSSASAPSCLLFLIAAVVCSAVLVWCWEITGAQPLKAVKAGSNGQTLCISVCVMTHA